MRAIEYVDRFARTSVDFWRLRPRDFVAATARGDSGYLSPYEFLVVFLFIGATIYSSAAALALAAVQDATGASVTAPVNALAVRLLTMVVAKVVVNALYVRAISRIWPVRGRATFPDILQFRLYALAALLPVMVLDLLAGPLLAGLVAQETVPIWSIWLPGIAGFAIGLVTDVIKWVPGVAAINGVSTSRMWAGLLLWPIIVSVSGGVVGGLVTFAVYG